MRRSLVLLSSLLASCALVSGVGDLQVGDAVPGAEGGTDAFVTGDRASSRPDGEAVLPDGAIVAKGGRLTGTIMNPAGTHPVYGAAIYVPSGPIAPFPAGVACDTCAKVYGGLPAIASTVSGADGKFVLDGVPADAPFRLVIQLGRFRRQVTVPPVGAAASAALEPALARLPATQLGGVSGNAGEGDLPQMALVTGKADQVECSLKKLGIAVSEFTSPAGGGRVHFYNFVLANGYAGVPGAFPGAGIPFPGAGNADALVDAPQTLGGYNAIILGCTSNTAGPTAPQQANMLGWFGGGGRLVATHTAGTDFIKGQPAPTGGLAVWTPPATSFGDRGPPALPTKIDPSALQGNAMASWLTSAGSTEAAGVLSLPMWRHEVTSVTTDATSWLNGDSSQPPLSRAAPAGPVVSAFSFDAPVGAAAAAQCGRVMVPEVHVVDLVNPGAWPGACDASATVTPEDLAFEFLFFRSMACLAPLPAPPAGP
jgi:hypothetical protein